MMIATSHWIISIGLAHTTQPDVALASYAVGMSTLALFETAASMLRVTAVTLVRVKEDVRVVLRAGFAAVVAFVAIAGVFCQTPALPWVFRHVLGVAPELIPLAVTVFRIMLILPMGSGLRSFFQGLIVRQQRTGFVMFATIVRLGVMTATIVTLVKLRPHWGGAIGAVTFLLGVWTEATLSFLVFRQGRHEMASRATPSLVTNRTVLSFLLPLMVSGMVSNSGRMFLNAGLAGEGVPAEVLAAFAIAWSVVWVIASAVSGVHQMLLVFADDRNPEMLSAIRRFFVVLAVVCVALIAVLSFTPLTKLVLQKVMGTPEELMAGTTRAMRWLVLLPLALAWEEWLLGRIYQRRRTDVVLWGKLMKVAVMGLTAGPGYRVLASLGSAVGSVAMVLGHIAEGIVLAVVCQRHRQQARTSALYLRADQGH
ncbi:MAG: hypothetical protein ACOX4G_00745 [Limnochordia bacterium]|jgi:Na+-driven multidrug efflux pump